MKSEHEFVAGGKKVGGCIELWEAVLFFNRLNKTGNKHICSICNEKFLTSGGCERHILDKHIKELTNLRESPELIEKQVGDYFIED